MTSQRGGESHELQARTWRRWPRTGSSLLLAALLLPLLSLDGCSQQDGFLCGAPLRDNPEVVGRCARNLEVCMCATQSCAVKDVGQFPGAAPEHAEDLIAGAGGMASPGEAVGGSGGTAGIGGSQVAGASGNPAAGDTASFAGEAGAAAGEAGASPLAGSSGSSGSSGSTPLAPSNAASRVCKSGYRYVGMPYANSIWADTCVPLIHLQTAMVGTTANPGPMCPTQPPIPPSTGGASGNGNAAGASAISGAGKGGNMSVGGSAGTNASGTAGMSAGGLGASGAGSGGMSVGGMSGGAGSGGMSGGAGSGGMSGGAGSGGISGGGAGGSAGADAGNGGKAGLGGSAGVGG